MTKYIEPRFTEEQLLKFAIIDAVMRSEDEKVLIAVAKTLSLKLSDTFLEISATDANGVPEGLNLSVSSYKSFGDNTEEDISLEEELASLTK